MLVVIDSPNNWAEHVVWYHFTSETVAHEAFAWVKLGLSMY